MKNLKAYTKIILTQKILFLFTVSRRNNKKTKQHHHKRIKTAKATDTEIVGYGTYNNRHG